MNPRLEGFIVRLRVIALAIKALPTDLDLEPRADNVRLPARVEAFDHQLSGLEECMTEVTAAANRRAA